jgi:hypothetical protein
MCVLGGATTKMHSNELKKAIDEIGPGLQNRSIDGVFLGDELCGTANIPAANFTGKYLLVGTVRRFVRTAQKRVENNCPWFFVETAMNMNNEELSLQTNDAAVAAAAAALMARFGTRSGNNSMHFYNNRKMVETTPGVCVIESATDDEHFGCFSFLPSG